MYFQIFVGASDSSDPFMTESAVENGHLLVQYFQALLHITCEIDFCDSRFTANFTAKGINPKNRSS